MIESRKSVVVRKLGLCKMIVFTVNNKSNQNVVVQFENLKSEHWTVSEFGGPTSALILLYLVNQKGIDVFIKESSISPLHLQEKTSPECLFTKTRHCCCFNSKKQMFNLGIKSEHEFQKSKPALSMNTFTLVQTKEGVSEIC